MQRRTRSNLILFAAGALVLSPLTSTFATHPAPATNLYINWNPPSGAARERAELEDKAADALRDVGGAQTEISRTYAALRREFENSTDWQDAVAASQRARAGYDLARNNALSLLQATPDYRKAEQEIWKAQQALTDENARHPNSPRAATLAAELMRRRTVLSAMESDCIATDERVKVARYAFIDADARTTQLQRTFNMLLRSDPRWLDARSKLDNARKQLAQVGR